MSDRIAVMNDGIIEQLGTPREIYEHPATRFVAGFIGTSNLLGGEVTEVSGGGAVISYGPDGRIEVPVRDGLAVAAGERLELTVRPEKIGIGTDKPADDLCRVRGTVTEVVYLGTSTNYNITTSTGADVVVFLQNATNADDIAVRGDGVWLSWDPRHSYAIGAPQ
jgi:spermidine/putrescine transport system ATP-binding protein